MSTGGNQHAVSREAHGTALAEGGSREEGDRRGRHESKLASKQKQAVVTEGEKGGDVGRTGQSFGCSRRSGLPKDEKGNVSQVWVGAWPKEAARPETAPLIFFREEGHAMGPQHCHFRECARVRVRLPFPGGAVCCTGWLAACRRSSSFVVAQGGHVGLDVARCAKLAREDRFSFDDDMEGAS